MADVSRSVGRSEGRKVGRSEGRKVGRSYAPSRKWLRIHSESYGKSRSFLSFVCLETQSLYCND